MNDIEFAKEVAEKVWGWQQVLSNSANPKSRKVWINGDAILVPWGLENIEQEVNSWQGFGKTVEAMAKADMLIEINSCLILFKDSNHHIGRGKSDILETEPNYSQRIIKAVHQAALDAIKEEG